LLRIFSIFQGKRPLTFRPPIPGRLAQFIRAGSNPSQPLIGVTTK